MSEDGAYGRRISNRFRLEPRDAVVVKSLNKVSFAATRLATPAHNHGRTVPVPPEDTLSVVLKLRDILKHELYMGGKPLRPGPMLVGTFSVVDLADDPILDLTDPFDVVQFYIPRSAFDCVALDAGIRRIDDLICRPGHSYDDPVIRHLGYALLPALDRPHEVNQLFVDHIASAMHLHLACMYGGMRSPPPVKGGLASWQLKRAAELLSANLNGEIALAAVASACGLSLSHFTRAFRNSTGEPPHRWLLGRRVDSAKSLLRSSKLSLSEIAAVCGFADQSHFTRIFRRYVGVSPGEWRRQGKA
ncbi:MULTISPECIES: AraC family transcriptional regulator [Rhodomicrobium]|uniref:helix-turn-helix domain-containing protein n=1 Tax=Rhodomicrobium TaxID=1068 RepID=UPI000B4B98DD|nr:MULTISPECIES: AraC family transcriptional regulator [Rhodomicrobium]